MVLGPRAHDAVAAPHAHGRGLRTAQALGRVAHRQGDQVDGLGGVFRPHDLVRARAHERGQGAPRAFEGVGRLIAQQVRAPVDRTVGPSVEVSFGTDDGLGLLRGRRRVEVRDGRAAAPDAAQNREVRSDRVELGGGEIRGHGYQSPRYLS